MKVYRKLRQNEIYFILFQKVLKKLINPPDYDGDVFVEFSKIIRNKPDVPVLIFYINSRPLICFANTFRYREATKLKKYLTKLNFFTVHDELCIFGSVFAIHRPKVLKFFRRLLTLSTSSLSKS